MTDRYWVGGTETWNSTAGSKWAATSGGAGGETVPTTSDNVFFDGNSGTGTVTTASTTQCNAANLNFTGFTGTLSHAAGTTINIHGSLTMVAGMTYTRGNTQTSRFEFEGTSGSHNITWAGKAPGDVRFGNGAVGGSWTLQDALTSGGTITINGPALVDFNEQTVSALVITRTGTATTTFDITNCNITVTSNDTSWNITSTTGLTLSTSGSTINATGNAPEFQGGGLTYGTVVFDGSGAATIQGSSTFGTLTRTANVSANDNVLEFAADPTIGTLNVTGAAGKARVLVRSTVKGTQRIITVSTAANLQYVDFEDINAAGSLAADWSAITGLSGNCGGNSNMTLTSPVNNYWVGGTGSASTLSEWANSSGGSASSGRIPLPQDYQYFDANSGSGTFTQDLPRIGSMDFTGAALTQYTKTAAASVYGDFILNPGVALSGAGITRFEGRGSYVIDFNGKAWANGHMHVDAPGGTYTWQDDMSASNVQLLFYRGTIDFNDYDITVLNLNLSATSDARTASLGNGTIEVTGTGTVFQVSTANLTLNAEGSTIFASNTSATTKTFQAQLGTVLNNVELAGGTGVITINAAAGGCTMNHLDIAAPASVRITAGDTLTLVVPPAWVGSSGNTITLQSPSSTNCVVSCASGTAICDWLVLQDCTATGGATFYAGSNSTDGGDNPGWIFTDPPGGTVDVIIISDGVF